MKIIIDADACPKTVLEICFNLGKKYTVPVWTVASFNHRIQSDNHFIVGNGPDEADLKVLNLTAKNDVVITQDWGLAAMVLGKRARCLSPRGREYLPEKIDFLLEERAAKARYRRGGGRTKGPKKRTRQNDRAFAQALARVLRNSPARTDK